ncbi:hypothetical protein [Bergeyella zoohelcum]|uniref:Phosphoribosyl-ATP pyrophosphatase n=1 Tax=Bergeyella zoohelcum TaxID=1015 RepID=A0A380ZVQ9_9FLAO|nr:hypothetical protein [Bergeyella zoohelcum]EKB59755.1 hypothetical protein HMPREF9700_01261 [Bergeyella zoohelcum CCUG 30536]SUV52878.1 Uncharacterised protein [Bergeyella zoohelcum]
MATKYTSLDELRKAKAALKTEIERQERLFTFENGKQSLGAITGGLTDRYLNNTPADDGGIKTVLNKDNIIQDVKIGVKNRIFNRNAFVKIASSALKGESVEGIIKMGVILGTAALAKKKMKSKSWKDKLLGAALIYLAPTALRFVQKKLDEVQKQKSINSLEKII